MKLPWRKRAPRPAPDPFDEDIGAIFDFETVAPYRPPSWRARAILILLTAAVLVAIAVSVLTSGQARDGAARSAALRDQQRALVHRLAAHAAAVRAGQTAAGAAIPALREAFEGSLGVKAALESSDDSRVAENSLRVRWNEQRPALDRMLDLLDESSSFARQALALVARLQAAENTATRLFAALSSAGADPERVTGAGRLASRIGRLAVEVDGYARGAQVEPASNRRIELELDALASGLRRLSMPGADAGTSASARTTTEALAALGALAPDISQSVRELLRGGDAARAVRDAARSVVAGVGTVLAAIDDVERRDDRARQALADQRRVQLALIGAAVLVLLALGWHLVVDARRLTAAAQRREEETGERNRRNQDAILRLLDEISELADGNLTAHATVTEEVTGAVADAVNYAIDALRELVAQINKTGEAVAGSAQTTRLRTSQLSAAAVRQTQHLAQATVSMKAMADAGRDISERAASSRDVARRSLGVAKQGAGAVRETISGMSELEQRLSETAKRLKRLGESSQEIGNMVTLIDDIADQTNVLALNATIQAQMAGEAGRGFGVVADEVQRLAERARAATKRIEGLVGAIQADTGEAIRSMEDSTAGVVAGTRLAHDAGNALGEIERVSGQLATLTGEISGAAGEQADRAAAIANAMEAIARFAVQVRSGTNVTAKTADRLAELAEALRGTVARFRLPSTTQENVVDLVPGMGSAEGRARSDRSDDRSRIQG